MKDTLSPDLIYNAFEKGGFPVLRIDKFFNGQYAEIRAEVPYENSLSVQNLQEITLKLKVIEQNEKIDIQIIHLDMIHKTMRLNFTVIPST